MGDLIGILSTVILVSTLATLIFAVSAYIMARRRRTGSAEDETVAEDEIPEKTEPLTEAPFAKSAQDSFAPPSTAADSAPPRHSSTGSKPVFRQLTPQGEREVASGGAQRKSDWDWE